MSRSGLPLRRSRRWRPGRPREASGPHSSASAARVSPSPARAPRSRRGPAATRLADRCQRNRCRARPSSGAGASSLRAADCAPKAPAARRGASRRRAPARDSRSARRVRRGSSRRRDGRARTFRAMLVAVNLDELRAMARTLGDVLPIEILTEPERDTLAREMHLRRFRAGEVIYHRGDPASDAFVVFSGLVKLVLLDDAGRLAKYLLELRRVQPDVPITQEDLAAAIGSTRVTVNKLLADFERRGLVRVGPRRFEVVDPHGLEAETHR